MTFADALALGRVSNLPTVWTNMLTGIVLAGSGISHPSVPLLALALTLFYVGGMYLNDFFDAEIDARERPERPIPSGRVSRLTVGVAGFVMLGAAIAIMASLSSGPWPLVAGSALAGTIVLYNAWHKGNPLSPLLMGLARMLVYLCAGVAVGAAPTAVLAGGLVLLCYLIGLTYVAKQETLGRVANLWPLVFLAAPLAYGIHLAGTSPAVWLFLAGLALWIAVALRFIVRRGPGDIPRAVVSLIAGISLVDAVLIAAAGSFSLALLCVVGFALTLALQRVVSGT